MLFDKLDKQIKEIQEANIEDLIPYYVVSRGFVEWLAIFKDEFPSLYQDSKMKFYYKKFFARMFELLNLDRFDKTKMKNLEKKGFEEFLNNRK